MPKGFISDEEMIKLEGNKKPGFISDEEMAAAEALASKPQVQEAFAKKHPGLAQLRSALGTDRDADYFPSEGLAGGPKPVMGTPFDNPLFSLSAPSGAVPGLLTVAGGTAKNVALRAATSPIPDKISKATNVVGGLKGKLGTFVGAVGDSLPPAAQKTIDLVSGAIGRKAAYSNPVTGIPQAISDTAKGVSFAQKGLAAGLDKVPNITNQVAPVVKTAAGLGVAKKNGVLDAISSYLGGDK